MFSVCIPVYRYNALALVEELLRQVAADGLSAEMEILLYDDASPKDGDWGRSTLRSLAGLCYMELEQNLGRAAIRNRMARDAQGAYCIMLDADADLPPDFLLRYRDHLKELTTAKFWEPDRDIIVVGGRSYAEAEPADPALRLHWWYGHQRESDVSSNAQQGWLGFHSNNFLVNRSLLLRHPFPEAVAGYGHEDTLWGQQFMGSKVYLSRVHNPVVHLGLEPGDVFLRKQQQAIRNLHRLKTEHPHLRTRLIDLVEKYPRLTSLARILPEQIFANYLCRSARPNLKVLDLLKLKWWHELAGA